MRKDFIEDEIFPLTITSDRYGGVYSGGNYVAWNLLAEDVPEAASGDDESCYNFWLYNEIVCGIGRTVSGAVADLYLKLNCGVQE